MRACLMCYIRVQRIFVCYVSATTVWFLSHPCCLYCRRYCRRLVCVDTIVLGISLKCLSTAWTMAGTNGTWPNNTTIKKGKGKRQVRARGETKRTARVRGREGRQQVSFFWYNKNCDVVALICGAPDGIEPNQAQEASPMVLWTRLCHCFFLSYSDTVRV